MLVLSSKCISGIACFPVGQAGWRLLISAYFTGSNGAGWLALWIGRVGLLKNMTHTSLLTKHTLVVKFILKLISANVLELYWLPFTGSTLTHSGGSNVWLAFVALLLTLKAYLTIGVSQFAHFCTKYLRFWVHMSAKCTEKHMKMQFTKRTLKAVKNWMQNDGYFAQLWCWHAILRFKDV